MKKILIFFIGMFLCIQTISAQTDTSSLLHQCTYIARATIDSTKALTSEIDNSSVTNKVYSDVKAGIIGLAQGLKVGAEEVFIILVRQQIVNSIVWLILLVFSFYITYNWFKALKSDEEWKDESDDAPTMLGLTRLIQIILSLTLNIVFICNIDNMITGFINPKYGAIMEIIKFIK